MKFFLILFLVAMGMRAQAPKKVDKYVLNRADWKCHYIIQGAKPASIRSMYQVNQCFDWQNYADEAAHIAALRLYRAEVEVAFPPGKRTPELAAYLRAIDAEEVLWW